MGSCNEARTQGGSEVYTSHCWKETGMEWLIEIDLVVMVKEQNSHSVIGLKTVN